MADVVLKAIPRPKQLRGLLRSQIKVNLAVAIAMGFVTGGLWKVFVGDRRKRAISEFYKDYDPEADFHRMRNLGLFDTCAPDP